ncbi:MAG TPA: S8 family serine peptidase [Chloroflexia bacterium]|nr:S8 family serine peptidase [Chloroflexia bacterium]
MKKVHSLVATVLVLVLALAIFPGSTLAADNLAPLPAPVQRIYDRTDKAVLENRPGSFWVWGPRVQDSTEDYVESPGGKRQVYYFEKGRLEITDPAKNPNDKYYATSGLLLREMITGQEQVGNAALINRGPANVPLAGDLTPGIADSPTYASLTNLVSFDGSWRSNDLTGQPVAHTLALGGAVSTNAELAQGVTYAMYYKETGHNVAKPFMDFMNQKGTVYENGRYVANQPLFDPLYVFGYPIAEPYWTHVTVAGKAQWVLVQAFERRLLTYTPSNPDPYKVELGNLGLAYVQWRYKTDIKPFYDTDPDYQRPTETLGFQLYNGINGNMQSLTALKRAKAVNGKIVSQEQYQAPDKARYLDATTYRGQPATVETIIVASRTYQRLIVGNQTSNWFYQDTPSPFTWPQNFPAFQIVSLNDQSLDWQAGTSTKTATDITRPLFVNFTEIDGSKYTVGRLISEMNGVILNSTVDVTTPEGAKLTQTTGYSDFNVPNNIVAPPNAIKASSNANQALSLKEALSQPISGNRSFDSYLRAEMSDRQAVVSQAAASNGVLVKFKNGYQSSQAAMLQSNGTLSLAQGWSNPSNGSPVLFNTNSSDLSATLDLLKSDPAVEYAVPNYVRHSAITTFNDPGEGSQYYLNAVKVPRAWDVSTGSKGITVAVIDSGIDLENPDLKGNIAETYNSQKGGTDVTDVEGHGSWTGGIIGAIGNNNVYGTGIAWNTRILAIKADEEDQPGSFSDASVIKALHYATDHGARVINMSLGGPEDSPALRDAVAYATNKGVVVVVASGNAGNSVPEYPASYPKVISVGATGLLGQPAAFSSYGSHIILSAPGVRICNTVRAGQFACPDGTSASAPIVSAAAGLILSVNPNLTADQVKAILIASATPAPGKQVGQRDDKYGYGMVNIGVALRMAATNQFPTLPGDLPQ